MNGSHYHCFDCESYDLCQNCFNKMKLGEDKDSSLQQLYHAHSKEWFVMEENDDFAISKKGIKVFFE